MCGTVYAELPGLPTWVATSQVAPHGLLEHLPTRAIEDLSTRTRAEEDCMLPDGAAAAVSGAGLGSTYTHKMLKGERAAGSGSSVVLLHSALPLVGVSIETMRECQ